MTMNHHGEKSARCTSDQATGECWPKTDREWARGHVVESPPLVPAAPDHCMADTPNGCCVEQCGECSFRDAVEAAALRAPPLVPLPVGYTRIPINAGHGHVRPRPDGMKSRCGGPRMCSVCAREQAALFPVVESPPLAPVSPLKIIADEMAAGTARFVSPPAPTPRLLIAFTGLAGSGKSTAAAHLVKHRGFTRVRFAGPLKAMMAALGLSAAEIDGDRKEQPCELLGGKTPRWAMQSLGTEWGRDLIGPDIWIRAWNAALANVPAGVPVVVDDCRFPNEAAAVTSAGGILVHISRPGPKGECHTHSSEAHALPAARTLHNTLTEKNLREQVDVLLRDFSWADLHAPS